MSIIGQLFRSLCMCIVLQKGSWTPTADADNSKLVQEEKSASKNRNSRFKREKLTKEFTKPEWLKQWTISKGWMHNRSHLLNLGRENSPDFDRIEVSTPNMSSFGINENFNKHEDFSADGSASASSGSLRNIDELLSNPDPEEDVDYSLVFEEISRNYRENFPDRFRKNSGLPEVYREKLLRQKRETETVIHKFVKRIKRKRKPKELARNFNVESHHNSAVKKEELPLESTTYKSYKSNLGQNIAIFNTLNSKTNLHEDTIYECSEDGVSLYNNPLYEPVGAGKFLSFHTNHICKKDNFKRNSFMLRNSYSKFFQRYDTLKCKLKSEKYIIRHIKIRIMLSMRLGKFRKVTRKISKDLHKQPLTQKSGNVRNYGAICAQSGNEDKEKIHQEQKKIGCGKTSMKIQNMRHGRLNVLRWLLWEAQTRTDMPALDKGGSNTTLALHYAAARGCLDCVRLLVDTTPDLSANTQMDNDVTPVYLAAQEGHLDVLKFLVLEAGGSLYVRAKDGMAPIHAASQMGCLNCVKWMIQEQGVDPNLRDGDGATPLHFAASRGHLETVRWLLKHGARLSLDKYGKSPINDAAENQQVECLNVLVQHGTTPDYNTESDRKHSCSCTRKSEQLKRSATMSSASDCSSCKPGQTFASISSSNQEPFYLHPPVGGRPPLETPHAPQDGLYINPMNNHRHSVSSASDTSSSGSVNGESFYLHNPQEVIYNRVKDLFDTQSSRQSSQNQQSMSALTVKVEVHSSSSGAASDENLSSSDMSERSGDHDHDYEDIYLVRDESAASKSKEHNNNGPRSRSKDSGSHSRSDSGSSANSGKLQAVTGKDAKKSNEFLPKPQKYEKILVPKTGGKKESQESGLSSTASTLSSEEEADKTKLHARHSVPIKAGDKDGHILKRVTSVPLPPPLPPMRAKDEDGDEEGEKIEIVEEPTIKPSDVVRGMCRSMSAISSKRLNSSCSDLTIISLSTEAEEGTEKTISHLVNKQRVLPFVPPSFPGSTNSNNLIKPSEYLKSISDKRSTISSSHSCSEYEDAIVITEKPKEISSAVVPGPPPPPLPETYPEKPMVGVKTSDAQAQIKKHAQPLAAISIQDLNSVQLRRTDKMIASKTLSAPTRSMSLQSLQSEPFLAQKTDLIAELKMSKDIIGIKKMKLERAKVEQKQEKEMFSEINKQFSVNSFVEKIPDKDNTGNVIPAWKRQMLAKKAAEKARKDLEEQMQREAEEKRLQAIPQWKRQLMAKKEEAEYKMRSTVYTPKVVEDSKPKVHHDVQNCLNNKSGEEKRHTEENNNNVEKSKFENTTDAATAINKMADEDLNVIPWRAQLRKTNSKLNLLD